MAKKKTGSKKQNERQTAARIVMDAFLRRKAISPSSAVKLEEFKDLPLASGAISYTIANFMNDDVVVKTSDDRYYFVQDKWKKLEKKVVRGYYVFAALPIALLILFLGIKHLDVIFALFK